MPMRLWIVVAKYGQGRSAVVGVFDAPDLATRTMKLLGEQKNYRVQLEVVEHKLNPHAGSLRAGEMPFQVLVNLPGSTLVDRATSIRETTRRLPPDSPWQFRVIVWARDEDGARRRAIQRAEEHAGQDEEGSLLED